MWWNARAIIIFFYCIGLNLFNIGLRYLAISDYVFCYACKEMDSLQKEYDYIVVGSGSAGSIIARRLAEDKDIKVLLLEAGSHDSGLLSAPAMGLLLQKSVFDWQYQTVPQKRACLAMDNHVSLWPMGKILGGTGMMNNMVYVRGHPEDFSGWFADKRNYDYDVDILPYFKKLEMSLNNDTSDFIAGSVVVSDLPFVTTLSSHILDAARSLGFSINGGLNSDMGFAVPKATMFNGKRYIPSHHLLRLGQKNVVIRTNCYVENVLLNGDFEAYGVKYSHLDEHYYAKATKAVILAAGAIGTPKILMLSGIGPRRHLESIKVTPKIDLPVGNNLQDHVTTGLDLILLNSSLNLGLEQMMSPFSAYHYFIKSTGAWTTIGCENVAFVSTKYEEVPDLQLMVLPVGITSDDGAHLRTLGGIGSKLWQNYFESINTTAITILPIVLHPKSRGTVRLVDKKIETRPLIDPKYLSDSYDVDVIIQGIELIKKLIATESMQELGARLNTNIFPGCEQHLFDTRSYWECYVRHLTITSYHPVGTCKLGEVVDYDFQVKGTNKLYVVDGSVLPSLPSGNPNAAIMMLAEKAADVIKYHRYLFENKCDKKDVHVPSLIK